MSARYTNAASSVQRDTGNDEHQFARATLEQRITQVGYQVALRDTRKGVEARIDALKEEHRHIVAQEAEEDRTLQALCRERSALFATKRRLVDEAPQALFTAKARSSRGREPRATSSAYENDNDRRSYRDYYTPPPESPVAEPPSIKQERKRLRQERQAGARAGAHHS